MYALLISFIVMSWICARIFLISQLFISNIWLCKACIISIIPHIFWKRLFADIEFMVAEGHIIHADGILSVDHLFTTEEFTTNGVRTHHRRADKITCHKHLRIISAFALVNERRDSGDATDTSVLQGWDLVDVIDLDQTEGISRWCPHADREWQYEYQLKPPNQFMEFHFHRGPQRSAAFYRHYCIPPADR